MKQKYEVRIDRGFRGVRALGTGEWDANDPEVKANEAAGYLAVLEKKTTPAPAAGASEDDEKEG